MSLGTYGLGDILNRVVDWANGQMRVSIGGSLPSLAAGTALGAKVATVTAGTPVSLGNTAVLTGVYVTANPDNTGNVYVFPAAGAKTDVVPLSAGDSDFWPVSNISALKLDSDVSGESVYWKAAV